MKLPWVTYWLGFHLQFCYPEISSIASWGRLAMFCQCIARKRLKRSKKRLHTVAPWTALANLVNFPSIDSSAKVLWFLGFSSLSLRPKIMWHQLCLKVWDMGGDQKSQIWRFPVEQWKHPKSYKSGLFHYWKIRFWGSTIEKNICIFIYVYIHTHIYIYIPLPTNNFL